MRENFNFPRDDIDAMILKNEKIWMDSIHLPDSKVMKCGHCKKPLTFLLQFYAPLEGSESTYHRALYVFICTRGECLKEYFFEASRVLRVQLPERSSALWDCPKERRSRLCDLCHLRGDYRCGQCKRARYCGRYHQELDWTEGGHRERCEEMDALAPECAVNSWWISPPDDHLSKRLLFDELEIVTEEEPEEAVRVYDEKVQKRVALNRESELPLDEKLTDPVLVEFQSIVSIEPKQVLRYTDSKKRGPIWVQTKGQIDPKSVPKCELCGSPRIFELQIMPQLVYYLKVEKMVRQSHETELDWGTLVIYTCQKSCDLDTFGSSSGAYVSEYIYMQRME
ncbi:programmed cell death protein 2-like isoform X2 [Schistocerca gregaria]|uniref:programmed cell death protein 2-like isoform X2 n=1 Tax=Schistocerca gregaria TaxID=7010 RepID=UPI00211EAA35|nr:programmed cell death protein 2-like isoform X2 [Schistocerca gregaria]